MNRPSGRLNDEMRPVRIIPGFLKHPDGSVLIETGDTRVLCSAMVEERVPSFLKGSNSGWVTAEYSLLPGSTETRSPREAARGRISGRTSEIQRLIGRSLRAIVDLEKLGKELYGLTVMLSRLMVERDRISYRKFCGSLPGSEKLKDSGTIEDIPLKDYVAAISVGIVEGTTLLDLDYIEDSSADVDMNVVMTGKGNLVEIQGTGEKSVFSRQDLDVLLGLAQKGYRN